MAIPPKRYDRPQVTYLTPAEVTALLSAPDRSTWTGRRDRAWILLAVTAGLRVSELTALTRSDLNLDTGPHVLCHGKGRKDRTTPVTAEAVALLRTWTNELPGATTTPLFPTRTGRPMSRDAVSARLNLHIHGAASACPSLSAQRVTPHVLRNTAAMRLLDAGVDMTIALWLGHAGSDTTQIYQSMQTWRSRNAPPHAPHPPAHDPVATSPATDSWPSSKPSDYADLSRSITPPAQQVWRRRRHNQDLGIIGLGGIQLTGPSLGAWA